MLHVGEIPERYDIALSTRGLNGIVEYSPADLTVVVRAGTTVRELQEVLGKHNQFIPLHPPFPERATVGGALAAAMTGPWRMAYGSARDLTIGMRAALPSGQVAKSGGKVVKNVAGYDLTKLFVGSFGSLGVITEVAFKVFPLPVEVRALRIKVTQPEESFRLARTITALPGGVLGAATWTRWAARGGTRAFRFGVIVILGGTPATVRELDDRVRALCGTDVQVTEVDEQETSLANQPGLATYRVSASPSRLGGVMAPLVFPFLLGYPAVGTGYVYAPDIGPEDIHSIRERTRPSGGEVVLLQAHPELKRGAGVWGPPPPELPLMRRVKDVFDPDRVMSPGRFVGGL